MSEEIRACAVCKAASEDLVLTRERRPGSMGAMAQSFDRSYYLCRRCLALCSESGCVDLWERTSRKPRRRERVTVYARTLEYMIGRKR